ncbi:MAG: SDR family NAD(P)-dependent oxidoreductase, partial [Desulfomonilia bacterium]|nr:SDR family NAD(P)-dependent oxidoreductase [Desulfomonilia bacterium]
MQISQRRILITGAASGIGRAAALTMGNQGGTLFLTDIDGEGLNETCGRITNSGGKVLLARALDIA